MCVDEAVEIAERKAVDQFTYVPWIPVNADNVNDIGDSGG